MKKNLAYKIGLKLGNQHKLFKQRFTAKAKQRQWPEWTLAIPNVVTGALLGVLVLLLLSGFLIIFGIMMIGLLLWAMLRNSGSNSSYDNSEKNGCRDGYQGYGYYIDGTRADKNWDGSDD